ncbi:AMP-dependent synthetase/ligase [Coprobacter sp.]
MKKQTLVDLFEVSVNQFCDNTFLMEKIGTEWQQTSFAETREAVYKLGAGLIALGVKKGETIALLSEGRNAWIISELAMFYAGAINVPLSIKLEESNDLLFRLTHSDASYIFLSANQLPKIRKIKEQLPKIKKFIILDEIPEYEDREIPVKSVSQEGEVYLATHKEEFLKIGQSLENDDPATITYTSGTTADPKGVILTHRNYTANVEQSLTLMDIPSSFRTLIILPLDHCFAHVVGFYIFMKKGASVATVQVGKSPMDTLKNIPTNIQEVKPDLLLSVPALAKNFRKSIENNIRKQGKAIEFLFNFALKTAYCYNRDGWNKGKKGTIVLKPLLSFFDKILFSKVRLAMGGNLKFFIGGGALLDRDLQDFYYAIGIPMFQGYGLSEATPVISSNSPALHKFGTSGQLVKPLDIKIIDTDGNTLPDGEKGELIIRGENVMKGYWKNDIATQETIKNGWLHTGDMGYMDKDGFLVILGRFKSLLIGSDGEKYSPEGIEEAIVSQSPYIDQIMLYNNQNAYTVALIVPNKENLRRKLHLKWETPDASKEAIQLILDSINIFRKHGHLAGKFPERWLPTTFAILAEPFSEQNQMINSTMKMVRGKIEKHHADRIQKLYTIEGKNIFNEDNLKAIK